MKDSRNFIKKIVFIALPVLFVLSVVALIVQGGFYYSEFKPQIEVSLNSADENKFNELASSSNVAKVDRRAQKIIFQNTSLEEVKQKVSEDSTIEIVSPSFINHRSTYILVEVIILLALMMTHFYIVLRTNTGFSLRQSLEFYLPLLLTVFITQILVVGLMSIVSRFYQVSLVDYFTGWISLLFTSFMFLNFTWRYKKDAYVSFDATLIDIKSKVFPQYYDFILMTLLLLVPVSIGLGSAFVFTALFIFFGISIPIFAYYYLRDYSKILASLVAGKSLNIKRPKFPKLNRKNLNTENTVGEDVNIKQKKAKSTKKKKKKDKQIKR